MSKGLGPSALMIDFDIEFSARSMLRAILDLDSRFQDADAAEVGRRLRVVSGRSTPAAGSGLRA